MEKIIRVSSLEKAYGEHKAVKGISFDVQKGDLFAFLGTNGAGKSTTINILTGIIKKTSGDVLVNDLRLGHDDARIKKLIGVVYQNSTLDDLLTVHENMRVRGSLYGVRSAELNMRIGKLAEITGCAAFMKKKYNKLSGGERRRAEIACALIHEPEILFLDEPTTGLDPATRAAIWNTISDMRRNTGTTVFLTTHYMEEAANADDVVIIDKGLVVEHDTPINLKRRYTRDVIRLFSPSEQLIHELDKEGITYDSEKESISIQFSLAKEAIDFLSKYRNEIVTFDVIRGSLDDVFMSIVNRG